MADHDFDDDYDDSYFDAASDGFYEGPEDYEPSPYDGTYSEE